MEDWSRGSRKPNASNKGEVQSGDVFKKGAYPLDNNPTTAYSVSEMTSRLGHPSFCAGAASDLTPSYCFRGFARIYPRHIAPYAYISARNF